MAQKGDVVAHRGDVVVHCGDVMLAHQGDVVAHCSSSMRDNLVRFCSYAEIWQGLG